MKKRSLLISAAAFLALPVSGGALADDNVVFGYTGLLTVPTAAVMPTGYAEIQYNEINYRDVNNGDNSQFNVVIGLLGDRLELGATSAYAAGYSNDLAASFKLKLLDRIRFLNADWSLAAGWSDVNPNNNAGANFSEARYAVSTVEIGSLSASLGYGVGPDRLDGVFGGLAWAPFSQLTLLADTDGKYASVGVRLAFDATDSARLYALGRQAFNKKDPTGWGVGGRFNLGFDRDARWFHPNETHGLRTIRAGEVGDLPVVRAENAAFLQRQADSASAACAAAGVDTTGIEYQQERYGIPLLVSTINCSTGEYSQSAWLSQFSDSTRPASWRRSGLPLALEARFGLEERSFIGTEIGRLQYSTALQSSARLQGPLGLGGYLTYNTRLAEDDSFKTNGPFEFYRVPKDVREYAGQLAVHPVAGLIGVGTLGHTYVNAIEYDFAHGEAAYFWGDGTNRTRVAYGEYEPSSHLPYPNRTIKVISHRYWIRPLNTSVEIGGGDYFYDDRGVFGSVTRYFGDVTVQLYVKSDDDHHRQAGLSIGIPLTPHLGFQRGPVSVVGMPRFTYSKGSSFDDPQGANYLQPKLMVEPKPVYNLMTDWLDSDRMYPKYLDSAE